MPRRKSKHERPEYRIMVRLFDTETMDELRLQAKARGWPVAELVRTYIDWGLEIQRRGFDD